MSKLKEIIDGHVNYIRSISGLTSEKEEEIYRSRAKICLHCPLKVGNTCNKKMWIDPETTNISSTPKEGYSRGCGCQLNKKQKSPTSVCPAGFWGGEYNKNKK
jgi:hypothetical protein